MIDPETDYEIHINGEAVYTLSVAEGDYYTVPETEERSITITGIELFNPAGASVACFEFSQAFAIPKGEVAILSVTGGWKWGYSLIYHVCEKPSYLEEHRDTYVWDDDSKRLRAANYTGGAVQFRKGS